MKLVPFFTNNETSDLHFIVSDDSYSLVVQNPKWRATYSGQQGDHLHITRYATVQEIKEGWPRNILLHRFVLGLKGKENRWVIVDHKNNWLDNRLENLRPTSHTNNSRYSRGKPRTNPSNVGLPKGVYKDKRLKLRPYSAQIMVEGKLIRLGHFSSAEIAHEAYWNAAQQHFGEFAKKE